MPRIAALRLRLRHSSNLTLDLNRDDLVLRTAKIDAGDVLPRTIADVNTVDIRRRLPRQLLGARLRFGGGEVVEESRVRGTAVHSIALVFVSS